MNRITRLHAATIASLSALLLVACGPSNSSSSPAPATAADSALPSAAASKPATGSGDAAAGDTNTITMTGAASGTYHFEAGTCVGEKSPSGKLGLSTTTGGSEEVTANLGFDGSGQFSVVLTIGADQNDGNVWTGWTAVGATASRTEDTVKFIDVPVTQPTGAQAKVSGTLKCESIAALL